MIYIPPPFLLLTKQIQNKLAINQGPEYRRHALCLFWHSGIWCLHTGAHTCFVTTGCVCTCEVFTNTPARPPWDCLGRVACIPWAHSRMWLAAGWNCWMHDLASCAICAPAHTLTSPTPHLSQIKKKKMHHAFRFNQIINHLHARKKPNVKFSVFNNV